MTKTLADDLRKDFPKLYAITPTNQGYGFHLFGFECGDGWEPLIRRLSSKLEGTGALALQVKEKFGTLRFYAVGLTAEGSQAVSEAEAESAVTCETCGQPGTLRGRGWVYTSCDACEITP